MRERAKKFSYIFVMNGTILMMYEVVQAPGTKFAHSTFNFDLIFWYEKSVNDSITKANVNFKHLEWLIDIEKNTQDK